MIRITDVQVDPASAEVIAGLVNAAFALEAFFVDGDRISPDGVLALANNDVGRFFIAYDDAGVPVGSIYAEVKPDGVGYFGLLAVDGTRQGLGIGHQLVTRAEDHLREKGCHTVEITVVDLRTELFPYYARRGYQTDGRTAVFPRSAKQRCQLLYMSKPLA